MHQLQSTTATHAKTHFWEYLDRAQKKPVLIQKNNRDHSVLLSVDDFEDLLLTIKSYEAIEEGFVWTQESENILKKFRDAQS